MKKIQTLFVFILLFSSFAYAKNTTIAPQQIKINQSLNKVNLIVMEAVFSDKILFRNIQTVVSEDKKALRQVNYKYQRKTKSFVIHGLLNPKSSLIKLKFILKSGKILTSQFSLNNIKALNSDRLLNKWAARRSQIWRSLYRKQPERQIAQLLRASERVYKTSAAPRQRTRRNANNLTVFSLFSGEAAIQETLQRQLLLTDAKKKTNKVYQLQDLTGVEVQSHPFSQLLAQQKKSINNKLLYLANYTPKDHFFLQVQEPAELLSWLKQLSNSGLQISSGLYKESLQRDLLIRYLKRLQFTPKTAQQLLTSNHINELAIFTSDLYFSDNTDIAIVLDIKNNHWLKKFLHLTVTTQAVKPYQLMTGQAPAFWGSKGNIVILSSSKTLVKKSLNLIKNKGRGSLGLSDEFRYMQILLPAKQKQAAYLYLSDPLIRKMVGPRTKIAQYRRSVAKARLEIITAAQLLYQLDHQKVPTIKELQALNYIDPTLLKNNQITIDSQGAVHSKLYGSLANMRPLSDIKITEISAAEKQAYKQYMTDYSQFWRQYFDPIAIRLNIGEKISLETVILPLIQNTIYNGLRNFIGKSAIDLNLDIIYPKPIAIISANIEKSKQQFFKKLTSSKKSQAYYQEMIDGLGDSAHFLLFDNTPIVTWGSSDLLGFFSNSMALNRRSSMFLFPIIASLLTQPSAIVLDLKKADLFKEPKQMKRILYLFKRQTREFLARENFNINQISEKDAWVLTWNIEGLIKLHLYLYLTDEHLVISNQPMQFKFANKSDNAKSQLRLKILPENIAKIKPLFNLHKLESQQKIAFKNALRLMPLLSLTDNLSDALIKHKQWYGNIPLHPLSGQWSWKKTDVVTSNLFGDFYNPILPIDFKQKQELFEVIKNMDIGFQFEEEGARIKLNIEVQ